MRLTERLKANNLTAAVLSAMLATSAAADTYNPQQKLINSVPGCVIQLVYLENFPEETLLSRDAISEVREAVRGLENIIPEEVGEYLENNKDGFELLSKTYPRIKHSGRHMHMCGFVLDAYKQVLGEYSIPTSPPNN